MKKKCVPITPRVLAAILILTSVTHAADWTQFRGPNGSGISPDAKPPTAWSDAQNLKWKTPLPGEGTSSPILVGKNIFVTCWTNGGGSSLQRSLVCVDRETGKILWSKTVEGETLADRYDGYLQEHGYASHTPVSDGERVYVYFGKGGALALAFDLDGKELWRTSLGSVANAKNWGSASSPILYKHSVIISASEESHAVYALDKKTGKELWKAEGGALPYVFGTPAIAEHAGRADLLLSMPDELWALNPDTGKLRWHADSGLPGNIAPSVLVGDGVAYAFGGFPRLGAVAVKLGGKGDVTQSNVVWRSNNSSYVPTPVLHEGRLYFASDAGFATCRAGDPIAAALGANLPGAFSVQRVWEAFRPAEVARASVPLYLPEKFTPYRFQMSATFPMPELPKDNPLIVERVALGEQLFHEPALSKDNTIYSRIMAV